MLIKFNVTNFKSIKEKQTLNMTATALKKHFPYNVANLRQKNKKLPNLLKSSAIYGANAAGKSNLIKGLAAMRSFIVKSHVQQQGDTIKEANPFLFNTKTNTRPSEFEVIFIGDDSTLYKYGFAINANEVLREWLFFYSAGLGKRKSWNSLFERVRNPNKKENEQKGCDWIFRSGSLKGTKERWIENVRTNSLFLSAAVQNGCDQLKPIFIWFKENLRVISNDIHPGFTAKQCEDEAKKNRILSLLKTADPSIHRIKIEEKKVASNDKEFQSLPRVIKEILREKQEDSITIGTIEFSHYDNEKKEVFLTNKDESEGTQKIFSLAGPLLDIMDNGRILVIDEMDSSLHSSLVRGLIEIFHNPEINKKNAQLIFSTHDTSVLDKEIFRLDQIWLVEKNNDNATELYSLSDFKIRQETLIAKRYLKGLFGGVPYEKVWASFIGE